MYKKGKEIFKHNAHGTQKSPYGVEADQIILAYQRREKEKERKASKTGLYSNERRVSILRLRFDHAFHSYMQG
jgi:hypothetical protein